jgi:hypothetical protein
MKAIHRLKNLSVDARKTLKWLLINRIGLSGMDFSTSTMGQVVGFCVNGNGCSRSVRLCCTLRVLPASRVTEIQIFDGFFKIFFQMNKSYIITAELQC